jgi:acyl carrier protein
LGKNETKDIVREYIVRHFLPGEDLNSVTDQTKLFSGGILDSLASLRLVSFLEERFAVTIEAHEVDVDHLDTLDSIADLVIARQG